jgi:hypothetical protein
MFRCYKDGASTFCTRGSPLARAGNAGAQLCKTWQAERIFTPRFAGSARIVSRINFAQLISRN